MVQGAAQFCRKDPFEEVGGYDESVWIGEDVDFCWSLRKLAGRTGRSVRFLCEPRARPSCRRFDRWPVWKIPVWTNPVFIGLFRRWKPVWKGWYSEAVRRGSRPCRRGADRYAGLIADGRRSSPSRPPHSARGTVVVRPAGTAYHPTLARRRGTPRTGRRRPPTRDPGERPMPSRAERRGAGLVALFALAVPSGAGGQVVRAEPGAPPPQSLEGRPVVLVTGSTSGLGREVALAMAERGAHAIVHGRDRARGLEVVEQIAAEGTGSASFYRTDLGSMAEVRALGEAILRDYGRLDVLVNNAGIWLSGESARRTSADGHELSFAVNYLSHFLLTRMLLPIIPPSPTSRIVNVSSGAQTPIDFDDPMLEEGYSGSRGYAQSKLAQILFTFDLAEELADTGIRVNALHPATLMDTNMVLAAGVRPRSSVEEGLEAVMHLIISEDVGSGQYFDGLRPSRAHAQAYDGEARARLRRLSEELAGR